MITLNPFCALIIHIRVQVKAKNTSSENKITSKICVQIDIKFCDVYNNTLSIM